MIGHCFGSALFAAATMVGQQMASLMTVSLALGFQIVFYFAAQYIFFYECCTALGINDGISRSWVGSFVSGLGATAKSLRPRDRQKT